MECMAIYVHALAQGQLYRYIEEGSRPHGITTHKTTFEMFIAVRT
jgi:hypothetical protein